MKIDKMDSMLIGYGISVKIETCIEVVQVRCGNGVINVRMSTGNGIIAECNDDVVVLR